MSRVPPGIAGILSLAALGALLSIGICGNSAGTGAATRAPDDISRNAVGALQGKDDPLNDENETMAESDGNTSYVIAPEELLEIPPGYNAPCDRPGTLERFEYDTFEAFSYEDRSRPLGKDAIVYVPAGYDACLRYNVVYLMHGGGRTRRPSWARPSPRAPSRTRSTMPWKTA